MELMSIFIRLFSKVVGDKSVIAAQNPVVLSGYAEPQPDLAILRWRRTITNSLNPHPEDVLLLIEVSDSTLKL